MLATLVELKEYINFQCQLRFIRRDRDRILGYRGHVELNILVVDRDNISYADDEPANVGQACSAHDHGLQVEAIGGRLDFFSALGTLLFHPSSIVIPEIDLGLSDRPHISIEDEGVKLNVGKRDL